MFSGIVGCLCMCMKYRQDFQGKKGFELKSSVSSLSSISVKPHSQTYVSAVYYDSNWPP